MDKLRPSSIVLLTRRGGAEVYLVDRAPQLRFFGGYRALPGGVVDRRDRVGDDPPDGHRTLLRCAARELFEETGVLVPELARGLDADARAALRNDLIDETPAAEAFWERMDATPEALDALLPFGELVTPAFAPVRYRTRLYHLELPAGEDPTILPGELVGGNWIHPAAEFDRWLRGEARIVPPVLFLLNVLRKGPLVDALDAARVICAELEQGQLHPVRFTPGVLTLPLRTPTIPPATTTNTYFVGERELYVVDPATPYPDEQHRLFRLMDRLLAEGRTFAGILATHHHPDHIGAVVETSHRYDLAVHGHALTLDRIPGDFRRGRELTDGDTFDLGTAPDGSPDWRLEAYHTPGHDRGHLVFVESRYRAAIAGDLVSTLSTIVIDPPEGHLATYLASLARMRDVELGTLYPAHGPATYRSRELLAHYLKHRGEREEALIAALGRGVGSVDQLVPEVYSDVDAALYPVAARSLLAGLEKLAEEGRVTRGAGSWSLVGA
ncbi:MAG: MBL fold metallo-hydrolase [Planctomycetota bacterium]